MGEDIRDLIDFGQRGDGSVVIMPKQRRTCEAWLGGNIFNFCGEPAFFIRTSSVGAGDAGMVFCPRHAPRDAARLL